MARVEPFDGDAPGPNLRHQNSRQSQSHRRRSSHRGSVESNEKRASVVKQASAPGRMVLRLRHAIRDFFLRSGWYDSELATRVRKFLRGNCFSTMAMVSLFGALFLGDIFSMAQVSTNTLLDLLLTTVFVIFALEFIGLSATDTSYIFGFFFWMDLLGTASMIFDISFMFGVDVSEPDFVTAGSGSSSSNLIVVRATRATKLGARAGRISRVLKLLRWLPMIMNNEVDNGRKVKVAKVISNQLANGLSTRVAFLTITVVVVMPLFTMFAYPEMDDSMEAWTELLDVDATAYHDALTAGNSTLVASMKNRLVAEVTRMQDFYKEISYGPFSVDYGESEGVVFTAKPNLLDLSTITSWTFAGPERKSSSRIVSKGRIQTSFNLMHPKISESGANVGLIFFIILVMICFGLLMSNSISTVALQPLERMLSVVRERCTQIFKYTDNLKEDSDSEEDSNSEFDDMEHDSEFVLLEKVVAKLAAIANLSTSKHEVELKANMTENEIMQLSWMQGASAPAPGARFSVMPGSRGSAKKKEEAMNLERAPRGAPGSLPMAVVEALQTPDFNSLDLSREHKISVGVFLLVDVAGVHSAWARDNIPEAVVWAFSKQVEAQYAENPFHNFAHAIDVEYGVLRYMGLIDADRILSETVQLSLLVAAIGHDIGHTGVNNQYLMETGDELAVRYNDRSPLENMHCAKLFQVIATPENNLFVNVERDLYKDLRKGIIHAILHTDVTKHNEMIKELGMLYQMNSHAFDELKPELAITSGSSISLISGMLLHGADVSNPIKPWDMCQRLAHLCMDEFFAQGDLEKQAGIPVQMLNDREKVNRPNAQIGFIEFFIAPMVTEMVHLFPPLHGLAAFLGENIRRWSDEWEKEASPAPDAVAKVSARVKKVSDNMSSLEGHAREVLDTKQAKPERPFGGSE